MTPSPRSTGGVGSFLGGHGEVDPAHADDLSVPPKTLGLLLDLVGDRKRDLVLLDAGVENLLVEERGRLRFEEDAGSLFVDHLVILSGQWNDAEVEIRLRACPFGNHPQTARLGSLVRGRNDALHGLNRVVGECEQRAHLLPGWFRSEQSRLAVALRSTSSARGVFIGGYDMRRDPRVAGADRQSGYSSFRQLRGSSRW